MQGLVNGDNNNSIMVYIVYPGKWILKANVLMSATSKDLRKIVNEKEVQFSLDGNLLNDTCSFYFYGLKEKDIIFVLDNKISSDKLIKMTQNNEDYRERMYNVIDPSTSREMARLRDIQIQRLERKPRFFRKVCSSVKQDAILNDQHNSNLVYLPKFSISTDPLPTFWNGSVNDSGTTFSEPSLSTFVSVRQSETQSLD